MENQNLRPARVWTTIKLNACLPHLLGVRMSLAHTIDEVSRKIEQSMPESMRGMKNDAEKTVRSAVMNVFQKMELVTREEFDIQTQVLARTRARLEALEKRVEALEKSLADKPDEKPQA